MFGIQVNFGIGFILKAESRTLLETTLPSAKRIEIETLYAQIGIQKYLKPLFTRIKIGTTFSNHKK